MTDAVIGMVVVLCAYLILKTINPYTTQMVTLTINTAVIPPVTDTQGDVASISGATCVDENSLTSISGIPNITASSGDNRLEKTTAQALTSAGQFALQTMDPETKQSFSGLKVYSAVRTQAKQQQLWDAHRAANPNETEEQAKKTVAKPSDCSTPTPHMTGRAVDIHLMLGGSELVGKDMTQARIDALQAIMTKAGWYRYCAEWWHFEFGLSHDSTRSQNCGTYTR